MYKEILSRLCRSCQKQTQAANVAVQSSTRVKEKQSAAESRRNAVAARPDVA